MVSYRHIVIASVSLAALCTLPILIPEVVAEGHVAIDFSFALLGSGTLLGHVVLLLGTLKKGRLEQLDCVILQILFINANLVIL